ncbi:DUF5615 family PIN-like protein [Patulibacter defluvii]|uniref:DUF5615 family PIN-like protein n=1 Tax=Patulibacter defluvii TaxID=3095358 RepID=UPI002A75E3D4|nr:DUF5615 family PIN-like protein [Patulibacter sp. DM4]
MLFFFDECLPEAVAGSLRGLGIACACSGEPDCPARGERESDEAVVAWCQAQGAILLTGDLGSKSPEMIIALHRTKQPVVFVRPQPRSPELAHAMLEHHVKIIELHREARAAGKHTIVDLDLSAAMRPKVRRRKQGLPNLRRAQGQR